MPPGSIITSMTWSPCRWLAQWTEDLFSGLSPVAYAGVFLGIALLFTVIRPQKPLPGSRGYHTLYP